MLYDNRIFYKNYNEILQRTDAEGWNYYSCPNPECRAKGCFKRYSTYIRHLVILEDENLEDLEIEILRLKCLSCKHTTNILPMEAIPFWQYSITLVFLILSIVTSPKGQAISKIAEDIESSFQLFYVYLRIFNEYRDKLILLFRSLSLCNREENPPIRTLVAMACSKPPPFPQEDYMRTNRSPLFLHRRNTVSYPLRCGFYFD